MCEVSACDWEPPIDNLYNIVLLRCSGSEPPLLAGHQLSSPSLNSHYHGWIYFNKFSIGWELTSWCRSSPALVAMSESDGRDWGLNIDLGPPQPRPTCYYEALPWLGSDSSQELRQWMARREERPDLPGLLIIDQSRRWWAGEEEQEVSREYTVRHAASKLLAACRQASTASTLRPQVFKTEKISTRSWGIWRDIGM